MKKFVSFIVCLTMLYCANAQTHHFVYIENLYKQPFSAKLNGINFESSNKNFITIPKLDNGIYNISISTEVSKDNKFTINIDGNDVGYTLKQNANNDFVLFDINRFTNIEQDGKQQQISEPIIKQEIVAKKEPEIVKVVEEKIKPIAEIATPQKIDSSAIVVAKNVEVAKPEQTSSQKNIKKIYSKKNNDGIDQIYVDASGKKTDTITIFIPHNPIKSSDTIKEAKAEPIVEKTMQSNNFDVAPANNCKAMATEKDVADFSAKLQMVSILKTKLKVASAALKEKCYTVNQIKRLSVLFANESGKFNFFKLAQTSISDSTNFVLLEKEITDEILKKEFLALINPQ